MVKLTYFALNLSSVMPRQHWIIKWNKSCKCFTYVYNIKTLYHLTLYPGFCYALCVTIQTILLQGLLDQTLDKSELAFHNSYILRTVDGNMTNISKRDCVLKEQSAIYFCVLSEQSFKMKIKQITNSTRGMTRLNIKHCKYFAMMVA